MSLGSQIAWDDAVLPFQLDKADIRGRIVQLDSVLKGVLSQHDYPPVVQALVAEAVMLTALIGQMMDLRWKLSLQIRGNGPVRLIATDYYGPGENGEPARIRAFAGYNDDQVDDEADGFAQIGKGYFAVLIDQGEGNDPYQGITPIAGGSLGACAETYFAQSEQIPTRFSTTFSSVVQSGRHTWRGGGIMMQHMPKASPHVAFDGASGDQQLLTPDDILSGEDGENWNRANLHLDTVEPAELLGPAVQPPELLVRLFHEEEPRVFDAQPVTFGCSCSAERVRFSMSMYSSRDIEKMTTEDGKVTADCQFCGAHYEFDPATLGFEAEERSGDGA